MSSKLNNSAGTQLRTVPRFAALHRSLGHRVRFFGVQYTAPRRFGLSAAKDFGVFFPSVQDTSGAETVKALYEADAPIAAGAAAVWAAFNHILF